MTANPVLLAAGSGANLDGMFQAWVSSKSSWGGFFVVLGSVLLLTLMAFVWAAFFRKQPRRHHSHHHRHHWRSAKAGETDEQESSQRPRSGFRFWRRHRPRHRKRLPNPTLAETGGLPPARADSEPPPAL